MNDRTESRPYFELDDDERYYATAAIDEIRRELEHDVRVRTATAAVRALIHEQTAVVRASAMYLQHLGSLERIAGSVAHRHHLTADDTLEFVQIVRVRLFDDDYAIIRKFEGRSSFSTFLTTVIGRLYNEWRVAEWGKWRPSAQATSMGEKAITLERLLSRDGLSFPEAVTMLTQRHPPYSVEELEAIYVRLPLRKSRPVLVSDETALAELPSESSAEERLRAGERELAVRSVIDGLDRAMGDFSPKDRLILQLRFWSGKTVPEIARIMGLEPKKVYKRLERSFKTLRRALQAAGIDSTAVDELTDEPALDLSLEPRPKRTANPSSASGRTAAGSNGDRR